jgi:uncharacterized metal-binding protein YceD (DUF177 family)
MVKDRQLPAAALELEASEIERAALARRFGVARVDALRATVSLEQDGKAVRATGSLTAQIVQNCAVSGEEFAVAIDEPLVLRFVEEGRIDPALSEDEEIEIELSPDDCDEIEYSGESFDLGEAIAQSLGLAIDPYAEGPGADTARKDAGIVADDVPSGPLADALRALTRD